MRNLKRALSLALASVMVIGMMVVGASAASYDDFSDKDEIVNKEAVQMLVELGVIAGKDDGSYDPTGIVTRAEMAKMICVVLNGGKDPSLGNVTNYSYADTVGHWAAAYIEYCSNLGIVAGDGAGKFNPNATVTGSEAAKMLLVAMGYKSEVEGFTGSNWAIGVNVRANQKGLYSDLSISVDAGLTRDSAAQMVYNALDAGVVSYDFTLVTDGSTISSSPTLIDNNNKTLLEDKFNAVKVEGVVVANEYANLESTAEKGTALDAGETKLDVTNYGANEDQNVFGDGKYSVSTSLDMLGKSVTLYVKKDASSTSKATILGNAILSEDNVVVTTAAKKTIAKIASDNDLDISGAKILVNYTNADYTNADYNKDDSIRGVEKVLIDNDNDGDAEYVLVNTYSFGQVTKYSTKDDGSITISTKDSASKTITLTADDADDVVGFEDVAKDDYVLAAWIGGKLYVEKAESVIGTLDAYKAAESLTVDGTKYDVSLVPGFTGGTDEIVAASSVGSTYLDNEATFYLDKNGMIVAVGNVAENAYDFAYLWAYDAGDQLDDARAKVTLSDGTTKTYTVDKVVDKNGDKLATVAEKTIYAYSINSDNEIKLTQTNAKDNTEAGYSFTKGNTKVNTSLYATNNTVFFYVTLVGGAGADKDNVKSVDVYTGYKNAPSVTGTIGGNSVVSNGSKTTVTAVAFEGATVATKDVSDHLYITDVLSASSKYTEVKAILAGTDEETTIKVDTDDLVKNDNDGEGLYLFTVGDNDIYTLSKDFDSKNLTSSFGHISDSTMVIGSGEYKLTDKTVVLDLTDGDANATLGVLPTSDDTVVSALVSDTDDGDLLMIIIDNTEEKTEEPVVPTEGIKAVDLSTPSKVTVSYEGKAPSTETVLAAVQAEIEKAGYSVKSIENTATNEYTFTATKGILTQKYVVKTADVKPVIASIVKAEWTNMETPNAAQVNEMMTALWEGDGSAVQGINVTQVFTADAKNGVLYVEKSSVTKELLQWVNTQWSGSSVPVKVTFNGTTGATTEPNWDNATLVWVDLADQDGTVASIELADGTTTTLTIAVK